MSKSADYLAHQRLLDDEYTFSLLAKFIANRLELTSGRYYGMHEFITELDRHIEMAVEDANSDLAEERARGESA